MFPFKVYKKLPNVNKEWKWEFKFIFLITKALFDHRNYVQVIASSITSPLGNIENIILKAVNFVTKAACMSFT